MDARGAPGRWRGPAPGGGRCMGATPCLWPPDRHALMAIYSFAKVESMPRYLLLGVLTFFCASSQAATPAESLAAFHAALETGNAEQAQAMLKPDVQIFESGYVERSRDEYARHHLGDDMLFAKATRSKVLRQSEMIEGNQAVVMRETETTGQFKGKPVHLLGTETVVMDRQGDQWLFSHIHWSSRKAAK
jgi:hypothetical protein